jgi:protein-tyrosine phosphatase
LHQKSTNFADNEVEEEYELFMNLEYHKSYLDIFQDSNPHLDRYSDIKPYKHNTLKISNKSQYINASPINIQGKQNYFISTQGPKPETIEDFWTMVYDYNSNIVVMLCKLLEGGRKKCENYWEAKMKSFEIVIEKEETFDMYVVRTLKLKNLEKKDERIVYQFHFTGWPDHGVPDISNGKVFEIFCEINKKVDELNKGKDPIIVHCSAGVGRTGTFVSMYLLEKEIMKQINDKCEFIKFNIFNLVRKIKEMRMYMVQAPPQYEFIYSFVKYLLDTKNI